MAKNFCIDCGKEISPGSVRCLSCAASARNRKLGGSKSPHWKGGLVDAVCQWCGATFKVKPSWLERGEGKCCSIACRGHAHSVAMSGKNNPRWIEKVRCNCKWCGVEFAVVPSVIRNGGGKFCSADCHSAWMAEYQSGENSAAWRDRTLLRQCESCGKEFVAPACVVEEGKGRFCSRDCYGAYFSGERRPQWQGGISFDPYPPAFNETFKRLIRERDDYTCAVCRLPGKCVHHVNYVKQDTDPRNALTLCRKCHSKTNSRREYWRAALSGLVEARCTTGS